MTTTPAFVRLEGTPTRIRKVMKDVNGRVSKIIRGNEGLIYVELPSQELGWIDKVAKDLGVKKVEMSTLPTHSRAPCGALTVNLRGHSGRCKKCADLRPLKPHNGEARTVVKVEGLHNLTLDGLISLMKVKRDEALTIAQEYDTTIIAVEKLPTIQVQLEEITKQMDNQRQALKYFMERK